MEGVAGFVGDLRRGESVRDYFCFWLHLSPRNYGVTLNTTPKFEAPPTLVVP
jgi:hypothetical protein